MNPKVLRAQFPGADGSLLDARLDLPAGPPAAFALFAHCFTCSKDLVAARAISAALTDSGIAVLRFDFTGLGSSEGEFGNTNFSSNVNDLVAAAEWLRREHQAPRLLIGHSLGGAAVIRAATQIEEVRAVATIGAPFEPSHVQNLFADALPRIQKEGSAEVSLAGRPFTITRDFLEDTSAQRMADSLRSLKRSLLILHSPVDEVVGIENARQIFDAAFHPKSFISLDAADHLLNQRRDAVYVAHVLAAWSTRYLGTAEAEQGRALDAVAPPPGVIEVIEAGAGLFAQHVAVGAHRFRSDEPQSLGGDDSGPTPYDLLAAALGTCTSMTIRMYARQKKWPLDRVSVRLRHTKIHASDCAHCLTDEGRLDRIEREVTLEGALDDAQRARLMEIADKCPVHRTLHAEVDVVTREQPPSRRDAPPEPSAPSE